MSGTDFHPKQLHLVLVGGGHAQVQLLKSLAMTPIDGLAISLVTDVLQAPYSGMLPGYIEGVWQADDIHIDLARLASFAGATLIQAPVTSIDGDKQIISIADRPDLHYDILSLNCGAVPDLDKIDGAKAHSIAVKPIAHFIDKMPADISDKPRINIIGAGVAGLELAFAFHAKYKAQDPDIHIFSSASRILPKMPKRASLLASRLAKDKHITLHHTTRIAKIDSAKLWADDGTNYDTGLNFIVTAVKPPAFVASLKKGLDDQGFVRVTKQLQSEAYPSIFATGDIANFTASPREKAGVFAVRAGQILIKNIRRYIQKQALISWRPQNRYLALIGTGDGKAIAVRGNMVLHGAFWWRLKQRIDLAFMTKFSELPQMAGHSKPPLPRYLADGYDPQDPIFKDMRCAGCAAKASASLLSTAFAKATHTARQMGIDEAYLPSSDALSLDTGLTKAQPYDLRHSFDSLNQMISDPYLFARIAVTHALSDLYVAGARPLYAQAHINLEEASEARQDDMLTHMLTGSFHALSEAKAQLVGGHTSQSLTPSLGFAVTGAQTRHYAAYQPDIDYALISTKPLGIGVALAAHMRQKLSASGYDALVNVMLVSNETASEACFDAGAIAITDITGFGLARHAANLLARFDDSLGLTISLAKLPILSQVTELMADGIYSSAFEANQKALELLCSPSAANHHLLPLLYDPQTSGGVLAIVPQDNATQLVRELNEGCNQTKAAIIGSLSPDNQGLLIES